MSENSSLKERIKIYPVYKKNTMSSDKELIPSNESLSMAMKNKMKQVITVKRSTGKLTVL